MAMRIRSMSAGRSGASVYNANVNGDQGGGDKKQGLAPTTNKRVEFVLRAIKREAYSTPEQRSKVFCINQLGGIGRPSKMFATTADGVNKSACHSTKKCQEFIAKAYTKLLNRPHDEDGMKTYTRMCIQYGPSAVVNAIIGSKEYKNLWAGAASPPTTV